MNFSDWTAKAIEHRTLEMADTIRKLPAAKGPKAYGPLCQKWCAGRSRLTVVATGHAIASRRPRVNLLGWRGVGGGLICFPSKQNASLYMHGAGLRYGNGSIFRGSR